ncbi:MAG TPA: hypothetical protein DHW64_04215 [Chitinophagaceae bacterium]|nr:hypothetical protein [Chitinophagaceae bacterium]
MASIINFFTIIGSIATAVSAAIACITLQSLKKQRESTYKPDIVLEPLNFYIYSIIKSDLPYPCEWSKEDKGFDYNTTSFNNFIQAELHNLGLGAARYISARYDFDMIESMRLTKAEMMKLKEDLRVMTVIDQKRLEVIPASESSPFQKMFYAPLGHVYKLNHILPDSVAKDSIQLPVISQYLFFISLSVYLMWATPQPIKNTGVSKMKLIDLPPLFLVLTYFDIANKEYNKKFELRFSLLTSSKIKTQGVLNVKEIG